MKLLLCPRCGDIFNLRLKYKKCGCGYVSGIYTDNLNAIYKNGIPFCIANDSFEMALFSQQEADILTPDRFHGIRFHAWMCPANSTTFRKAKNVTAPKKIKIKKSALVKAPK